MEERFGSQIIRADVPLAEMFGYSTTLRSMSQGRATHSMEFHHYAEAPRNVADEIIASRAKKLSNVPGCDARRLTRATLVPAPRPGKAKPPPGKKVSTNWGRNARRRCACAGLRSGVLPVIVCSPGKALAATRVFQPIRQYPVRTATAPSAAPASLYHPHTVDTASAAHRHRLAKTPA